MGERNTGFGIAEDRPGTQGKILQIDEGALEDHLGKVIRGTVEETLNGLLDAEADRMFSSTENAPGVILEKAPTPVPLA